MPKSPSVRIVLVRPRNPLNIGACARALANFGYSDLVVVDPFEPIWKETRSAPKAETVVRKARRVKTLMQAVKGCSTVLGTSAMHDRKQAHSIVDLPSFSSWRTSRPTGLTAIVFGPERSGLSNEELSSCDAVVRIPIVPSTGSMNLAQAVAVVLYAVTYEVEAAALPQVSLSAGPLIEEWVSLATSKNYPPGYTVAARQGRFKQALKDVRWTPESIRLLLSFARWLGKKPLVRP